MFEKSGQSKFPLKFFSLSLFRKTAYNRTNRIDSIFPNWKHFEAALQEQTKRRTPPEIYKSMQQGKQSNEKLLNAVSRNFFFES
jgi:hypothetical protein